MYLFWAWGRKEGFPSYGGVLEAGGYCCRANYFGPQAGGQGKLLPLPLFGWEGLVMKVTPLPTFEVICIYSDSESESEDLTTTLQLSFTPTKQ